MVNPDGHPDSTRRHREQDTWWGSELRVHAGPDEITDNTPDDLGLTEGSVALLILRVPAFQDTDRHHTPSLGAYRTWLNALIAEAARVLEPGGRIAVIAPTVVCHRPYVCLATETKTALDAAGLLLRDEIVWIKVPVPDTQDLPVGVRSWVSPHNPATQYVSERILIGCKEQVSRWGGLTDRAEAGLPCESDLTQEAFARDTIDVWFVIPEGWELMSDEPEPLPAELVARLIGLHTYVGDLVVDPMCGTGEVLSTAAVMGRRYWGAETNESLAIRARLTMAVTNHEGGTKS